MEQYPTLEDIYEVFKPELPKKPDGKEPSPYEVQRHSFIEGFKTGLQLAAEALIH